MSFWSDYSTTPAEENSPPPPTKESKSGAPPPKGNNSEAPPPKDGTPSSPPPPPKGSSPPPPSSSSPPPPKEASATPPPPREATPTSPPPPGAVPALVPPPPNEPLRPPAKENPSSTGPKAPADHKSQSKSPDKSSPSSSSGDNSIKVTTLISVGVVAGLVLLLVAVSLCICCLTKKKKKKPEKWSQAQMQYYGDPSRPPNGGKNYYEGQNPNWYGHQGRENSLKRPPPPPPGFMGHPGGGYPGMSSGEMSSNFSDPHYVPNPASPNLAMGFNKSTFTYDELATATNGFSQANLLGQGGFGYVHKGILQSGKIVAVKSLKVGSGQGEREFQAEVDIISRVHHRHLVSLVGYCIAGGQRMLVYEYVPNKTLEYHLHVTEGTGLDWSSRLMIAIGSAKGLAYLHEDCHPRIIHRDIKAANILLDNNFEAMVADFGLAKLSADNFTHVSTRVMGTFGYLAPEYASSGKLTEKSDVFSFGVMLLELITGRRPVDTTNKYMDDSLVDWARPLMTTALANDEYDELVDDRLRREYNHNEMKRMIACAAASVRHSAKRRPKMSQIVRALEGDVSLDDLNDVGRTAHQTSNSNMSSEYNTREYNEDLKKFRKMALETQGEDPDYTSTYGLNPSTSSDASSSRELK